MATKKAPSKKSTTTKSAAKKSTKKGAKKGMKKGGVKRSGAKKVGGKADAKFGGALVGGNLGAIISRLLERGTRCEKRCVRTFINQLNRKGADVEAANAQLRRCIRRCEANPLGDWLEDL
ncbi:MAG TPA: hypothetical protein VFX96_01075 [Pyrinomonadaceae bacterium]|nr:hypothetical protein [Pyrinomonadaceae bacterium]